MEQQRISPLADRLKRLIWLWATLASLLVGSLQGWLSYRHVQNELADELRAIAQTSVPLLAVALWDIEREAVQWQVEAMAERPEIGLVRLSVPTGQVFLAGNEQLMQNTVPSVFEVPQPGRPLNSIGRLEVYADPAAFQDELLYLAFSTFLGYGLLTLLVCTLVGFFLRRHLENPLRQLAIYLGSLTPERLRQPLQLERPGQSRRDEIDLMVDGFRVMQRTVDLHVRHLDELVAQRTAELQQALSAIEALSRTDGLTGCFNRRHFDERYVEEFDRAVRYQQELALIFCDIDYFKRINDQYGHAVGDAVLKALKICMDGCLRERVDWVARYGGEEFVVVLPHTGLAEARAVAERLRQAVADDLGRLAGLPGDPVTASFGVAAYVPGSNPAMLLEVADSRLYAAKQAGRNRVRPAAAEL